MARGPDKKQRPGRGPGYWQRPSGSWAVKVRGKYYGTYHTETEAACKAEAVRAGDLTWEPGPPTRYVDGVPCGHMQWCRKARAYV